MQIKIIWEVTPSEASYVLQALAERPFKEVNGLIGKLNLSATEQVKEQEKAPDGNSNSK